MRSFNIRAGLAFALALLLIPSFGQARVYTLGECVTIALENNSSLASARESLEASNANVLSSWSGALPRISGSLSASKTMTLADGSEATSEGKSGSIGLSQTVFDATTFARISSASHSRDATRHALEAKRRETIFSTKQNYYGLLKAQALRDVLAEALELAQEQLRKTQSLFELGSASRSDLLKAQVQVGQAQLALITAEKSVGTARVALCYMLGIEVGTAIEVVDPVPEEGEQETPQFDIGEAVSRRPDVRAAEESVVAARRSLLASKAARWPDVNFSLSYGRSEDSFGEIFEDVADNHTRSMSVSLSLPIFNGFGTKASIASSKSALRTYQLALRDARMWAEYEIETERLSVLEQRQRVGVAEKAVAQADEDLRISEERFRLRAASMLELIDARVAYSQARADLVEARYDYEIAKAALRLALGL